VYHAVCRRSAPSPVDESLCAFGRQHIGWPSAHLNSPVVYVHNMAHPDESIVQGFLIEECISFYTNCLSIENHVGEQIEHQLLFFTNKLNYQQKKL
jgi:hypothetical protein